MDQRTRKGSVLVIGLLILAIIIIAAAAWYLMGRSSLQNGANQNTAAAPSVNSQTVTPLAPSTITWQTYASAMYGYTIQYPISWSATTTIGGSGKQFENTSFYDPRDPKSGIGISDVETCSTNQSLLSCAQGYIGIYQNNQAAQWNHTAFVTTTINTYPAVSTDLTTILTGQSQGTSQFIFFQKNTDLFKITFSLTQSSSDINIIDQMLSTFSFH